jgi:hypothetical protein
MFAPLRERIFTLEAQRRRQKAQRVERAFAVLKEADE